MAEYMRKIIYLRKKEGEIESSGSGYIRLERRGDELRIHLTIPVEHRFGELPVYAIYEKNKELYPLLLGRADGKDEWEYCQNIDTRKMEWYAEDILGFVIGDKDCYLVGESPDYKGKISYESIRFKKIESETGKKEPSKEVPLEQVREVVEEQLEPLPEIKTDFSGEPAVQLNAASENSENQDKNERILFSENSEEEESVSEERNPLKESFINPRFLQKMTEMYPFEDDEMEWCFGMDPKDFSYFPMEYWHYAKNTFLLQGFYNYRHLLYAHKEGKNYLGVPGQFHRREQFLAGKFGFPLFKSTKKKRTTVGDFGYWMKELD